MTPDAPPSSPPSSRAESAAGGTLWLVATPIGNLGDLSPRAVEALESADAICCEDTRRTGRLLAHAGIARTTLVMVNDHNESARRGEIVRRLDAGERVAVVTDAGMPALKNIKTKT